MSEMQAETEIVQDKSPRLLTEGYVRVVECASGSVLLVNLLHILFIGEPVDVAGSGSAVMLRGAKGVHVVWGSVADFEKLLTPRP